MSAFGRVMGSRIPAKDASSCTAVLQLKRARAYEFGTGPQMALLGRLCAPVASRSRGEAIALCPKRHWEGDLSLYDGRDKGMERYIVAVVGIPLCDDHRAFGP
jgi:hypothetical protein